MEGLEENFKIDFEDDKIIITIDKIDVEEEKILEFSIGTKGMSEGELTITTEVTYEGFYGDFSTSKESQITLEKPPFPLGISPFVVMTLFLFLILAKLKFKIF